MTGSGAHGQTGNIKGALSVSHDREGSATTNVTAPESQCHGADKWQRGLSTAPQGQLARDHKLYAEVSSHITEQVGTSGLCGSEEAQQAMLDYEEDSMEEGELREENEERRMESNWWQGA
ncbi:hypothetical protein NDU88_004362 [Pleurodeles waltl]|uniref:Uncharacterized protein n=1 Tax=Pleurodeles waltl TaxID=8319 RepID=A0AAV7SIN2_PLEWA|nr:hypothetical protein NDU88_004362 [Pleurodeles waltl]